MKATLSIQPTHRHPLSRNQIDHPLFGPVDLTSPARLALSLCGQHETAHPHRGHESPDEPAFA
jgi:hypothetical protein